MMKRSYSDMSTSLSTLPNFVSGDPKIFKTTFPGTYRLLVAKVADISKPAAIPIDEIEEPEEEDTAVQNKLSKSNARMIQLDLKDSNSAEIRAIEVEHIDVLTSAKPDYIINIAGPVDVRCGNLMLYKKHVASIEAGCPKEEKPGPKEIEPIPVVEVMEDWDEDDEEDCIILD